MSKIKKFARLILPPILTKPLGHLSRSREIPAFERLPDGWKSVQNHNSLSWNREGVVESERARWNAFKTRVNNGGPLGFSHESPDPTTTRNIAFHNIHIIFAYVLAKAAHGKQKLSVLDWGGGLGHYYLISKAILPEVEYDYTVHEVELMCKQGKQLCSDVHFCDNDECLQRRYDLVVLNGSLGYFPEWKATLNKVASAANDYLLLTRIFVVDREPTFVVRHRAQDHGYQNEMYTQVFNRFELLEVMKDNGFEAVREFAVEEPPFITGSAEQCVDTGWLFKRT